ncbi:MAG: acyl-CoA dehydrogenase family protein [Novosphingobium sp.]
MSEARTALTDMAEGLFDDLAGQDFDAAWSRLTEAGFETLLVPEEAGGFGGDWGDLAALLRIAGAKRLGLPLAETVIARWLLAKVGIEAPDGLITFAVHAHRTPWGRHAAAVIVQSADGCALYAAAACQWDHGRTPAGTPSDALTLTGDPLATIATPDDLATLLAFARVAEGAGALEAALALTVDHVSTRVQFGKTLSQFQAVQQALALLAEEAAALSIAASAAAAALDGWEQGLGELAGDLPLFEIAAAKARLGLAVDRGVPIAHRLHGAIGFTMEYPLNHLTRRLMGWRSEFGGDAAWQRKLGRAASAGGSKALWETLTARSDSLIPQV